MLGGGSVAFEGFVLYAGLMLLVQVMAYVMSGTFILDMVRRLAPESGPLIGSPYARFGRAWEGRVAGESVNLELLTRADVFVYM